jgi:glutamate/tyrosine decarboxylase-like PLP-dependent enzyme
MSAMNQASAELELLSEALRELQASGATLDGVQTALDHPGIRAALLKATEQLKGELPYGHPLYVGQMLKPPHPVARLAYSLALWINPNNHALDGGQASSRMEKEAVARIAAMFGWREHLGHLCSGGTIANFEALWISRELRPGKAVVASKQAHYTHERLSTVLQIPFRKIATDARGRMDVAALEAELKRGEIGTVVATLGTTAIGAVDPLAEIAALRERYDFRLHVDAAYGGYFTLARNLDAETCRTFAALPLADSIVVDPHKHGLQPYGCGCVLFRDPAVGGFYRHESPYTYFTSDEMHLGEISLECSRPGAAAIALWTTQQALPLERGGAFATGLEAGRNAALELVSAVRQQPCFVPLFEPQLDIVVWAVAARSASESSAAARRVFSAAAERGLHLALAQIPRSLAEPAGAVGEWDADQLTCLRACVMKPEHGEWLPEIVRRLREIEV